jgi:hypothetical protein
MKNKVTVLFLVSAIVFSGICLIQSRQNQALKRELATLRQTLAERDRRKQADDALKRELTEQQEALSLEVARLAGEVQSRRDGAANTQPSSSVKPTVETSVADQKEDGFGGFLAKMLENPEMKKMMRQQQGAMMDMMYGSLFKELGLTPEETDRFKELLLDHQMKAVEAGGAFMKLQGTDDKTAAMSQLAEQQKQFDEQVKAFLGDERYAQYKDYQGTLGERMTLNQFSQQMAGGQNPLNADQTSQLLEIMKQEKKSVTPVFGETGADGSATPGNWQAMMSEDKMNEFFRQQEEINQRVLDRARAVLTPEQLNALSGFQTNQLQMQRFGMSMAAKMMGGKKSEGTVPVKEKP